MADFDSRFGDSHLGLRALEQFLLRDNACTLELKTSNGRVGLRAVARFEIPIYSLFESAENLAVLRALLTDTHPPG